MKNLFGIKNNGLIKTIATNKVIYIVLLFVMPFTGIAQTTVYHETFGSVVTNPYTGSPSTSTVPVGLAPYSVSTTTGIISTVLNIADAQLQISGLTAAPVNGREFMTTPISGLTGLNGILNTNPGPVTWTFNMKTTRTTVMSSSSDANYGLGQYYSDVVLASTGSNLVSGTNGYVVIFQRSSLDATKNSIRLSRFTNGLSAGSGATPSGTSVYSKLVESPAFTSLTNSVSVKVVYTPGTETWELFYREDPTTTFVDPTTGILTSAGAPVFDYTYTGTAMTHIGYLGSHANSTNTINSFQYDNYKITVTSIVAINYYYDGTGPLNDILNWGLNTDGTGANPTNFSDPNQYFNIRTSLTTDVAFTVSGSGSKIIIGNASIPPVTVTIAPGFPITGIIDVTAASSGANIVNVRDVTYPSFGSLDANSEVHFQAEGTVTSGFFGKVFIDAEVITDTVSFAASPAIIKTSLLVTPNSFMFGSGTTANYIIASGAAITINGTFRTTRTAGLSTASIIPSGITANGVFQFSGAANIILGPASTIEFGKLTSASAQIISPRTDYFNLSITGDANNKTCSGPTNIAGTLLLNITGTSTLTGANNFVLGNTASIVRTNGAFDVAPTFGTSVNVTYNGTIATNSGFEIPVSASVLNNLTINNAAGVTLTAPATAKGIFNLTSGLLNTTSANILTLSDAATISGGSNTSFVSGPMIMNTAASAAISFPVGKGAGANPYRPVIVTPNTATASSYQAEYFNASYSDVTNFTAPITAVANTEYWDVSRLTGSDASVGLSLNAIFNGTSVPTTSDEVVVAHYTAGAWKHELGTALSPADVVSSGTVTTGVLSSFSPFTFGLKPVAVLPLRLISFDASLNNGIVKLNWVTSNEVNLGRFVIEESYNGSSFTGIGNINANNTAGVNQYAFTRNLIISGDIFYRLKIVNSNGRIEYSNVVRLKQGNRVEVSIYPNPVSNTLTISGLKNNSVLKIISSSGQIVQEQKITANTTSFDVSLLKAGVYNLEVFTDGEKVAVKTFIKE